MLAIGTGMAGFMQAILLQHGALGPEGWKAMPWTVPGMPAVSSSRMLASHAGFVQRHDVERPDERDLGRVFRHRRVEAQHLAHAFRAGCCRLPADLDASPGGQEAGRQPVVPDLADLAQGRPTVVLAKAGELVGPERRQALAALGPAEMAEALRESGALDAAIADVRAGKAGRVPKHLRDAHYPGARRLGHGKGYRYAHDSEFGVVEQQYLPDELVGHEYYDPTANGNERDVAARLEKLRRITRGH